MQNGMDRCPGGGSLAPFPPQSSRGDSYAGSRFPCISTPRQILHCDLQIARICAAMPCAAMPCHALSSADCPREHCGPLRWSEANRHGGHAGAKAGFSPSFPPFSGMGIKMGLAISKPSDTLARRLFFSPSSQMLEGICFSALPPQESCALCILLDHYQSCLQRQV
jgi:hypothetical protein